MDDRRSHWPIYNIVPIELIKVVAKAVREAPVEGKVVYFTKGGESSEKIREKR